MKMRRIAPGLKIYARLVLIVGLAALAVPIAAADLCKLQGHLDLPITLGGGVPVVRFTVSNKELILVVDTGAESTLISTSAADRLQLARSMVYPRRLHGLGGGIVGGAVALPGLAAAGVELPNLGALVGPIELPMLGGIQPDGLLGADILSDDEVDVDLAHARIRLFCSAGAPDWGHPYSTIEANRSVHGRLFFWSTLDAKKVAAIIDTGAQHSVVDSRAALAAGADAQAISRQPAMALRGISGAGGMAARPYHFRELVLPGEKLSNPNLLVAPLGLDDADLILGADFLRDRYVRLSYRSHRLLISHP